MKFLKNKLSPNIDCKIGSQEIAILNDMEKLFSKNEDMMPNLNRSLKEKNIKIVSDLLFNLNVEEYNDLLEKSSKIKNKILKYFLNGNVITDLNSYYSNNIFSESINYHDMPNLLQEIKKHNDKIKIRLLYNSEKIIGKLTDIRDESLEDYKKGETISLYADNNYFLLNKNCFSEEFNTMLIDYCEHYDIYKSHPRIGTEKLAAIKNQLMDMNRSKFSKKFCVEFKNFAIEV